MQLCSIAIIFTSSHVVEFFRYSCCKPLEIPFLMLWSDSSSGGKRPIALEYLAIIQEKQHTYDFKFISVFFLLRPTLWSNHSIVQRGWLGCAVISSVTPVAGAEASSCCRGSTLPAHGQHGGTGYSGACKGPWYSHSVLVGWTLLLTPGREVYFSYISQSSWPWSVHSLKGNSHYILGQELAVLITVIMDKVEGCCVPLCYFFLSVYLPPDHWWNTRLGMSLHCLHSETVDTENHTFLAKNKPFHSQPVKKQGGDRGGNTRQQLEVSAVSAKQIGCNQGEAASSPWSAARSYWQCSSGL